MPMNLPISLYLQGAVIFGWVVVGWYFAFTNFIYSMEAEKLGVGTSGMYWIRIDVNDPRCPKELKDAIRVNERRFRICAWGGMLLIFIMVQLS